MKLWAIRILFWLWFKSRGYYTLARVWRALFERKYRNKTRTRYSSMMELERALGQMSWRPDPLRGVIDVISHPGRVEHTWQLERVTGETRPVGDCDEFAVYAADRIEDMHARGLVRMRAFFLTVNWLDRDGQFHGHNVCAFKRVGGAQISWGHISNWHHGRGIAGFNGPGDVAANIAGQGRLIAWALATPDLKLLELDW